MWPMHTATVSQYDKCIFSSKGSVLFSKHTKEFSMLPAIGKEPLNSLSGCYTEEALTFNLAMRLKRSVLGER